MNHYNRNGCKGNRTSFSRGNRSRDLGNFNVV